MNLSLRPPATTQPTPGFDPGQLAAWSGGTWDPAPPRACAGLGNDTRTLLPGAVYIALTGERFDGHAFVESARRSGAAGAVVAAAWPRSTPADFPLLRVPDPQAALSAMAAAYRQALAPHLVGVTGSAGKTSVKEAIARALALRAPTARTRGNWNNAVGLPLSLLAMPADTRVGVFEVGTNHPGEIADLAALLQPRWGVVTNVGPAHIEHFGELKAIALEKSALLGALPPDGLAFLNADGEWFETLAAATSAPVVTVALQAPADFRLSAWLDATTIAIEERATGELIPMRLNGPGAFQAVNALFAVAVGRRFGVAPEALSALGLKTADGGDTALPMRWERRRVGDVLVINDAYNANPLSMDAALEGFGVEPVPGRRWLVLGDMLELGTFAREAHLALGRRVAAGDWAGLITVGALGAWIAEGAAAAGFDAGRLHACGDAREAAQCVAARVRAGDGLLLKASRGVRLEDVLNHWTPITASAEAVAPEP